MRETSRSCRRIVEETLHILGEAEHPGGSRSRGSARVPHQHGRPSPDRAIFGPRLHGIRVQSHRKDSRDLAMPFTALAPHLHTSMIYCVAPPDSLTDVNSLPFFERG